MIEATKAVLSNYTRKSIALQDTATKVRTSVFTVEMQSRGFIG